MFGDRDHAKNIPTTCTKSIQLWENKHHLGMLGTKLLMAINSLISLSFAQDNSESWDQKVSSKTSRKKAP